MEDIDALFSEFERQVGEITSHAKQVHKLDFSAKLINGTSFNFSYNRDTFQRQMEGENKQPYNPLSIFNAVVDILGFFTSITILVLGAIFLKKQEIGFTLTTLFFLLSMSFFATSFVLSALFHLFNQDSRAPVVFSSVKEALRILAFGMTNFSLLTLVSTKHTSVVVFGTLLLGSTAAFLLSLRTQGGARASFLCSFVIPYLPLIAMASLPLITTAILLSLSSLVSLVTNRTLKIHSNTTFTLIGICSLALTYMSML